MIPAISRLMHINVFSGIWSRRAFNVSRHTPAYYEHLSRNIAYALRHNPDACGLRMDSKGFVSLNNLLEYLNNSEKGMSVSKNDIISIIKNSKKDRFQLIHDRIRAYYGHSCLQRVIKEPAAPPKNLFHGTTHSAAEHILEEGITPQSRQYVHLSSKNR